MRGKMKNSETNSSKAVERALAIMESIAQRANGLTNAEISRKLEIPRSSASYILRTLEKTGYLRRERGTGKYLLGSKLFSLTRAVSSSAG
jgi:DNA-binding IclR family transcriptional regulator